MDPEMYQIQSGIVCHDKELGVLFWVRWEAIGTFEQESDEIIYVFERVICLPYGE
jgi:hypothetical protein